MSTIAKENEILNATPESAARTASPTRSEEAAARPQPVALEVPVSVNGVRTVEGSDKREPFSESTKTVLIFGNGAVIRLSSAVAAGQLLFLTNDKTRKEVVCQVVKSKNYRNVSGYVELEFTEPVVGFWGMRFPGDKMSAGAPVASGSPTASGIPAAPPKQTPPVAPSSAPMVVNNAPKIAEIKPVAVAPIQAPVSPVQHVAPVVPVQTAEVPVAPLAPAPQIVPPSVVAPIIPVAVKPEILPAPVPSMPTMQANPSAVVPALPVEDSTEALRQQAARLQEQLSSLLFAGTPAPKVDVASVPPVDAAAFAETTAKILDFASSAPSVPQTFPTPAVVEASQPSIGSHKPVVEIARPAAIPAPPAKSIMDADEDVKIPAWLEPLARNATAPATTQELIEREKAKHAAALNTKHELEELAAEPLPAPVTETPTDLQIPTFSSELPLDQPQFSSEISSGGSKKGIWIGLIAAVLVFAAAGGRYYLQGSNAPQSKTAVTAPITASVAPNSVPAQSQVPVPSKSPALPSAAVEQPNPSALRNQPVQAANSGSLVNANSKVEVARSVQPAQPEPQPKKPSLGEVHFAAPTVTRNGAAAGSNEPAPTIDSSSDSGSAAEPLGSGILAGNSKQPAAPKIPLPVGGDVKAAKLISSVPPLYSSIAKSQHVTGDVNIDALIDETGRVTTMKVVSGPTLLHQSAMDALRQWKYQPATLDGKAVPMHLTVTIRFRIQ
jgi:TonB family protein